MNSSICQKNAIAVVLAIQNSAKDFKFFQMSRADTVGGCGKHRPFALAAFFSAVMLLQPCVLSSAHPQGIGVEQLDGCEWKHLHVEALRAAEKGLLE